MYDDTIGIGHERPGLNELGGVLLARGVVNVLERSSCEPCWHWQGIEG